MPEVLSNQPKLFMVAEIIFHLFSMFGRNINKILFCARVTYDNNDDSLVYMLQVNLISGQNDFNLG